MVIVLSVKTTFKLWEVGIINELQVIIRIVSVVNFVLDTLYFPLL